MVRQREMTKDVPRRPMEGPYLGQAYSRRCDTNIGCDGCVGAVNQINQSRDVRIPVRRSMEQAAVTVHFVATNWDRAMGRFVGPVALFDRAREFMPELKAIGTHSWEWRGWVDLVEGSGALTPALRWRVPDLALARLWADHDGCEPDGEASSDAAAEAVATLRRWRRAEALWGRAGHTAQDLHPLDDPRDGAAAFIEDPFAVPWSPRTYDPVMVAHRGIGHPYADDHGCVPLFRGWQALLLIELFLYEPRVFAGLDRVALAERWPDLTPGPTTWWPWCFANGFAKHQAALDALSWHATYVNHALMLAEQSSPDPGMFASLAPASADVAVNSSYEAQPWSR